LDGEASAFLLLSLLQKRMHGILRLDHHSMHLSHLLMIEERKASGDKAMPGQPINCKTSRKVLASIDSDGLYLWCKRCNTHHTITWQELLKMREARTDMHPAHAK
jgi:hypothetical protein